MKNAEKSFIGIVVLFGACLVVLVTYVSLLGENNKIDSAVLTFFENLRAQRYFSLADNQNIVESLDVFDTGGEYPENCLALELALLEKYRIPDSSGYKPEIRKSRFWIPFTGKSSIRIDLLLKEKEDALLSFFRKSPPQPFTDDLFTVERKGGRWLITAINIRNSSLSETFSRIREELDIGSYITLSGTRLTVNPIEFDTKNIDTIESRKLNYIFRKLSRLTESGNP